MTRKYQLTRLDVGDYMFLSNSGRALWRVYRYREYGDAAWGNGGAPILGLFWAAARFDGSVARAEWLAENDPDEFLGWSCWEHWAGPLRSRREAIDAALSAEAQTAVEA